MREPPKSMDRVNEISLNVLLGAAVGFGNRDIFEVCKYRMGSKIRCNFDEAMNQTSWSEIKNALEMSL